MHIKRTLWLLALALVSTAAMAATHFLRAPSARLGSPHVVVNWSEVGLGNTGNGITYVASATAGARYQCVKVGQVCPKHCAKEDVLHNVYVSSTFSVDKNGKITGDMTIPAPESSLVCPKGQSASIVSVVFTNIKLTDTSNGISSMANPSALSYNGPECP
ncbi:hypothetical protein LVB87_12500 [Lysobacter sp. KIS68-7]|uniref:hypothetical protein n=1 Tax=Lysobacter sp. KIS68-7 TaxID=2904252 RepID=UPI001E37DB7D|nr:hypothetical protein [Lysobacter sp. KIS68-7]UHQ18996.1 hypothetical protein LVB87_12500 [Lysobacter sp. KIS68-7]